MTNIVKELRSTAYRGVAPGVDDLLHLAADEIEYLQEQIDILNDKVEACRDFMRKL